jgi:hypothetical protein
MDNKRKHLEIIQNVIDRMAANSFLLKGWTVTLVSAIFVLSQKDTDGAYLLVAVLPIVAFWMLDGFFLRQERLFRKLYDQVRVLSEDQIDFSMNTSIFNSSIPNWLLTTVSKTLTLFYGGILAAVAIATLIEKLR